MTYYIEQIPRTENAPFWTTELTDILEIRAWILENCDITKRHVISKSRMGMIKAEGIQILRFYGIDHYKKRPKAVILDRDKSHHEGYKVFKDENEALAHYYSCKAIADKKLANDAEEAGKMITELKGKGINFDTWATALDDSGLDFGFCVTVEIDGFYFKLEV